MPSTACAVMEYKENKLPEKEIKSYIISLNRGISRLEKLGESVYYPKKHVIVEAGQFTKYCYVVKKGRVLSYEICSNGEERIYHFNENHSIFLEENLLFGRPAAVSFRTACGTELIRIDRTSLMHAIKTDPQIALDIIESTSTKFQSSMEQVRHTRNYSIAWKICDLMISFAESYGVEYDGKILIREKISQQLISSMLGVNRITTVRAIKELKNLGLIGHSNGYYYANDMERLMEYQKSIE